MNGQEVFLWGLEITDALTMELTAQVAVVAFGVATICFICNMAYNYLSHGASQLLTPDENRFPDLIEIARCFALFFCLTLYTPIAKTIVGTLEVINEATSLTSERGQEFAELFQQTMDTQSTMLLEYQETALDAEVKAGEDTGGAMAKELDNKAQDNEVNGISGTLKQMLQLMNPGNLAAMLIHGLAALIIGIIQLVILGIGVIIIKILVILGPLVFAVSMLPVFQKQLANWFGTLCAVGMSFTVINILNQIMWFTFKSIYDANTFDLMDEATKQYSILAQDLAMIGAYCSCFWLAGKIVGHGDAGRIISKTVSVVTTAATMAIAAPAVAAEATNVGAAASLGRSIINDNKE